MKKRNIFQNRSQQLLGLFEKAGNRLKIMYVPIDYAKKDHMVMFCGLLYFLAISVVPDCLAGTEEEITHLLQYIEDSDCIFIRNGKEYGSSQAKNHLELKYKHAKRWIKTAEDFIKYIATKSSLSGMPYRVTCDGQKMTSSKWLKMELFRIRSQ